MFEAKPRGAFSFVGGQAAKACLDRSGARRQLHQPPPALELVRQRIAKLHMPPPKSLWGWPACPGVFFAPTQLGLSIFPRECGRFPDMSVRDDEVQRSEEHTSELQSL